MAGPIVLLFIVGLPVAFGTFGTGEFAREDGSKRGLLWRGIIYVLAWSIIAKLAGLRSTIPTFLSVFLLSGWMLLYNASERGQTRR